GCRASFAPSARPAGPHASEAPWPRASISLPQDPLPPIVGQREAVTGQYVRKLLRAAWKTQRHLCPACRNGLDLETFNARLLREQLLQPIPFRRSAEQDLDSHRRGRRCHTIEPAHVTSLYRLPAP